MCASPEQARIVMHDQVNRNILHVGFEASFVFKTTTETGCFEEFKESRHNSAGDINAAKGA
ncbi:hypothetical protein D3C71_1185050 [compost metagenome]